MRSPRAAAVLLASCFVSAVAADAVQVTLPSSPPGDNVTAVYPNFFGISFELSFINYYFGNDSSNIPQAVINYLVELHARTPGRPVRLRLGGNSMDSSTYIPDQQEIIKFTNPYANVNDQSVSFGSVLFDVLKTAGSKIGGVEWLIGLSLRNPNDTNIPLVAGDAQKHLEDDLDAYLLGNEPDLYTSHGDRPGMTNYTVNDYIGDYWVAFNNLGHTPTDGDVLSLDKIAGPTICCAWNLDGVLTSGWYDDFKNQLKYITLQHYPQNNCFGSYTDHLDYYMSHTQTVNLAKWQEPGLQILASVPSAQRKPVLMDEFNSASCGGIPESNMFGVALWTADYALQMAAVGYSGAYLHTREPGVPYNVFNPPNASAGAPGAWSAAGNFYAMLAVTEALQAGNGSKVVDLDVAGSARDYSAVHAGYAVYAADSSRVQSVVLFNYANASAQGTDFALPAAVFAGGADAVLVRYLTAPSATETTDIAWGNQTFAGAGDGSLGPAKTDWADKMFTCAQGCTVQVPGPGMAVVFVQKPPMTAANSTNSSSASAPGPSGKSDTTSGALSHGLAGGWWGVASGLALMAFGSILL